MFIATSLTIAKTRMQPKQPSVDDWTEMLYIHTMEYYSAIKRNKIQPFGATRMNLEFIILTKVTLKRKTNIT